MQSERTEFIRRHQKGITLDVGCVDGHIHQEIFNENVYGIDIKMGSDRRNFVMADALYLPFKVNAFDTIIAGELIEHLEEPEKFLNECARLLKKNGYLIITTPNRNSWINRLFKSYQHDVHISLFDAASLALIIQKYFKIKKSFCLSYDIVSSWGSKHSKLFWLRRLIHHTLPQSLQENMIFLCTSR